MTKYEKLILLMVGLLMLTRIGFVVREIYIAHHYGAYGQPPHEKQFWHSVSLLWGGLVNVGAAFWLIVEARAAALRSWAWALFGLCFGLFGVALFYLSQIHSRHHANET